MAIQLRLRYSQSLNPCELLKSSVLILLYLSATFDTVNHQIILSTLSSLDITGIPLRWFESYLTGRSLRVAWEGEVSKAHQLVMGFPRARFLDPSSSPHTLHHWVPSYRHMASPTISMLMTQLYLSFRPDDPTVAAWISGCWRTSRRG